jgi:hypothetical protein
MNEKMKRTRNILMGFFIGGILLPILIVLLFETEVLMPGTAAGRTQAEFVLTVIMELVTLADAWLALRLFKMGIIRSDLQRRKEVALLKWGTLRIFLLDMPMLFNAFLYEMFLQTTFGYLAIILLICQPFVYPSMARCESEVTPDNAVENEETNNHHSQL